MKHLKLLSILLACAFATTQVALGAARGRPTLNAARTTFVADNGQLLRGPFLSTEGGSLNESYDDIVKIKNLGCNAVHVYGECFAYGYPTDYTGSPPGYAINALDNLVRNTRDAGLYLVITIGNGWANGQYNLAYITEFWTIYAPRYANETHVLFEIQNEPVAWGPSYLENQNPPGGVDMEVSAYRTIRSYAPNTPVLLFTYACLWSAGDALKDIHAFNQAVFGNQNATWNNEAVAFHGYAGADGTATSVAGIIAAGYPCFMTEFLAGTWGGGPLGLDVEAVSHLERLGVSWLAFQQVYEYNNNPDQYVNRVVNSGLSWRPDYGTFPAIRSVYGNNGYPWTTPGYNDNTLSGTLRIQAEDFDNGGKNVAYYNGNSSNPGGQYRTSETVGIEAASDTGGGYNIGWIDAGDWLEYTITVPVAGTYDLRLRVASTSAGRVRVLAGGVDLTGEWTLPNTGGWQTWTTATKSVLLGSGQRKLRISVLAGGFNLNWIELSPATSGAIADGTYKFQNANSGQLLNLDGNNTVVTSSSYEQWTLRHIGGGQYQISSVSKGGSWDTWMSALHLGQWGWGTGGGSCFIILPTSSGNYRVLQAGGGEVLEPSTQNPPTMAFNIWAGTAAQQWAITAPVTTSGVTFYQDYNYGGTASQTLGAGNYTLSQLAAMGVPNDWASSVRIPNGFTVKMYADDNFSGISWTLTSDTSAFGSLSPSANDQMSSCVISQNGLPNGTYKLMARHSGKAMDAYGAQTANGTQIVQWGYGGGANQKWTISDDGGAYKIIGVQSGKCVDINGLSTANGSKVQLWDYLGGSNQKFSFTATDSGNYRITPTHATGSCLDVEGVSTADGAKVHLWQWGNGSNQQWAFQNP